MKGDVSNHRVLSGNTGYSHGTCGGTAEEKMEFVRWLAKSIGLREKETWFGDDLHYFSYNEHYALRVNIYNSLLLVFSCDDIMLKKKIDSKLSHIF